MASYATAADFDRFGLRAAALPQSITAADKEAAISAASSKADSYLRTQFTVPLATWGDDLRQAVCAIAAYELVAAQVGFDPAAGHNMVLVDRKNDAIRWLEQVSRGDVVPVVGEAEPSVAGSTEAYSETLRGW